MSKLAEKRQSLILTSTVLCAALYAVGSYMTAYIPSPWSAGQFRPAVIIPAFFTIVFGPVTGGVGAAIGTLLADSFKHGYIYPGSLLSAVPGNFIGFYLMGKMLKGKFTWNKFLTYTNVTLILANLIVAFLYVFVYKVLYSSAPTYTVMTGDALIIMAVGMTIYWYVTMLPFVLLLVPPLVHAAARAFPNLISPDLAEALKKKTPMKDLGTSMVVPGLLLILLAASLSFTDVGVYMARVFGSNSKAAMEVLSYVCGVALSAVGAYFYTRKD